MNLYCILIILLFILKITNNINMDKKGNSDFVVIFDLDYTIWPFWVDTHISPPFHIKKVKENGEKILEDGYGYEIKLYPEVIQILEKAKKEGIIMGTVSRTLEPEYGRQLLKLFDIEKYFISCEFDTGTKTKSMKKIAKLAGIEGGIKKCILYDDESRNINDVEREGGIGVLLNNGLTMKDFENGIKIFQSRNK